MVKKLIDKYINRDSILHKYDTIINTFAANSINLPGLAALDKLTEIIVERAGFLVEVNAVERALLNLKDEDREILRLFYDVGYTAEDICEKLNLNIRTFFRRKKRIENNLLCGVNYYVNIL